jgi:tRNA pseudouridine38-40 synthase
VASHPGDPAPVAGLNALLPPDVAITASEPASDTFDARRDAVSRTYCYKILTRRPRSAFETRRALHWPHAIDRAALDACARALAGTHDFTAFTPTETDHVRFERDVLSARWEAPDDEHLEFWITADAFMRHMNRVLIGTMLQVAGGRRTPEAFAELLTGAPRAEAGPTAPPHGLYFAGVGY